MTEINIPLAAEPIFELAGFTITNSLLNAYIAVAFFIVIALLVRTRIREIPKGFYNVVEALVEFSLIEIEKVTGWDGKAIKIQNLPIPFMQDYKQYKSVSLSHKGGEKEFSYSGTNGLASRIDASSKVATEK